MPAIILYVDSDNRELERYGSVLEEEGYEVFRARDMRSAMECFMHRRLDLVLMDFRLSETDGGIVAFEMRRRKPNVKIAFLTDDPEAPIPRNSVDRIIAKQSDPKSILPEVKSLLESDGSLEREDGDDAAA